MHDTRGTIKMDIITYNKEIEKTIRQAKQFDSQIAVASENNDLEAAKNFCEHNKLLLFIKANPKEKTKYPMNRVILDFSIISTEKNFTDILKNSLAKKPFGITGIEQWAEKDKIHYKSSGLSKALCDMMSQKNISLITSLKDILSAKGRQRAKLLGRIRQNIALCEKYKVKILLFSFAEAPYELASKKDMQSLAEILGMESSTAKKAVALE